MSIELKPCPFCGCGVIAGPHISSCGDSSAQEAWVECEACNASRMFTFGRGIPDSKALEMIAEAWNTRAARGAT